MNKIVGLNFRISKYTIRVPRPYNTHVLHVFLGVRVRDTYTSISRSQSHHGRATRTPEVFYSILLYCYPGFFPPSFRPRR